MLSLRYLQVQGPVQLQAISHAGAPLGGWRVGVGLASLLAFRYQLYLVKSVTNVLTRLREGSPIYTGGIRMDPNIDHAAHFTAYSSKS